MPATPVIDGRRLVASGECPASTRSASTDLAMTLA